MSSQGDREFLLSIFLMESWESAGALEDGLARLSDLNAPIDSAVSSVLVFAHRLKGSAALHGFPGLSALGALAESLLEATRIAAPAERMPTARFLSELVVLLKELLDRISLGGSEDVDRIARFLARRPRPGPTADPLPSLLPEPGQSDAPLAPPGDPVAAGAVSTLVQELDRFFSESDDILEYFAPEAAEHLDVMTGSLLALERGRDEEHLASVFRAVHTLKGAAYTVGCAPIGDVAHEIEDLLGAVREGRLAFTPAVLETTHAGVDALKLALQSAGGAGAHVGEAIERAVEEMRALMRTEQRPLAPALELETVASAPLMRAPELLRLLEPVGVTAAPFEVRKARERGAGIAGPGIRVSLDRLDSLMNLVGELMIARSRLEQRLTELDRIGELLLFSRTRVARTIRDFERKHYDPQAAIVHGPGSNGVTTSPPGTPAKSIASLTDLFAEAEFDRYDDFNIMARSLGEVSNDIGEAQAQHAVLLRAIQQDIAQIQRLTAALRKEVTRSRMVPIGRLFSRFARQVREAARAAGKTVNFKVYGESVEVDNSTIEQMADSLLHLVQNSITHGIEPEDERLARGKPAAGTISLRAYQQGGFIILALEDDGRGMDPERLKAQAVEYGLLGAEEAAALSTAEALNLIFVPGFSTAISVTRAAGRGVGMDVVRTNVTRLNGEIEVDTEVNVRTRFTVKLPLTVAIAEALMLRVGTEVLAVPLTTVGVMRLISATDTQAAGDRELVVIDGQWIELIRLARVLGLAESEAPTLVPVVVLRSGGTPFAVAVDELIGKEEIVVKSLGDFLEGTGPFVGATISGEGRVILLLDPTRLLELARTMETGRSVPSVAVSRAAGEEISRRVLLVDDSVSVRRFVGQMLEKAGFSVVTAVDGQDALERLTAITVDVIITDLEMPRVNGYALIEDLRRRPATRDVPIVVLTTRAGEKHQSLARRLGIRHYVTKPVDEQAFVGLVESILSPARELAAHGADHP